MLLHSISNTFLAGRDHDPLMWMRKVELRVNSQVKDSGFKPRSKDAHSLCREIGVEGKTGRGVVRLQEGKGSSSLGPSSSMW